ncbi:Hypothetical predicted protein, partial [Mytilus galloprovincialis]
MENTGDNTQMENTGDNTQDTLGDNTQMDTPGDNSQMDNSGYKTQDTPGDSTQMDNTSDNTQDNLDDNTQDTPDDNTQDIPDDNTQMDNTGDNLDDKLQPSYMSGQYMLIAQGTKTYPAVVDVWPYVYFYTHKKEDLWISASIRHSIISSEVVKPIDPPDGCLIGTRRFMYKFK